MSSILCPECESRRVAYMILLEKSFWTLILAKQPTFLVGFSTVRWVDPSGWALYLLPKEHMKYFAHSIVDGRSLFEDFPTVSSGSFETELGALLVKWIFHSIISFSITIQLLKLSSSGNSKFEAGESLSAEEVLKWRVFRKVTSLSEESLFVMRMELIRIENWNSFISEYFK